MFAHERNCSVSNPRFQFHLYWSEEKQTEVPWFLSRFGPTPRKASTTTQIRQHHSPARPNDRQGKIFLTAEVKFRNTRQKKGECNTKSRQQTPKRKSCQEVIEKKSTCKVWIRFTNYDPVMTCSYTDNQLISINFMFPLALLMRGTVMFNKCRQCWVMIWNKCAVMHSSERDLCSLPFSRNVSGAIACLPPLPSAPIYQLEEVNLFI